MQPINDSTKCWRIESTPNRKMASAMWRRAKAIGVPVKGWMDGEQCRVRCYCTAWTLWKIVNHARQVVKEEAEALNEAIEQRAAMEARADGEVAGDAGYSDDSWSEDEAVSDEDGRVLESNNLPYLLAIYDEARRRGRDSNWCRAEGSIKQWRVAVWDVSAEEFSEILNVASRIVNEAVAA